MVTIAVGKLNDLNVCRIETDWTTEGTDNQGYVEFPTASSLIRPGNPKWANYVKGVVAGFHGNIMMMLQIFSFRISMNLSSRARWSTRLWLRVCFIRACWCGVIQQCRHRSCDLHATGKFARKFPLRVNIYSSFISWFSADLIIVQIEYLVQRTKPWPVKKLNTNLQMSRAESWISSFVPWLKRAALC